MIDATSTSPMSAMSLRAMPLRRLATFAFLSSTRSMRTPRSFLALAVGVLLALPAASARAQGPTPEGTVITNTVTASYTDANGNTYADVSASATVTVGFAAAIDAASAASVTPASPSTGNTLPVTVTNGGNGSDTVSIAVSPAAGLTVTGYTVGGTSYGTLAALNTALKGMGIAAGGNVIVTITFDVATGEGGATLPLQVTATSIRSPSTSDATTTNIQPATSRSVTVGAKGATVNRLPSNGTSYSVDFTVTNGGNTNETFDLVANANNANVTIVSVNGVAGTTGSVALTTASPSKTITVVYTVADATAGSTSKITFTATAQSDNTVTDSGDLTVTVIKAALAMTKAAYKDDKTTAITAADRVLPSQFIQYKLTVTNNGGADASSVHLSDALPSEVAYDSSAPDAAGWTITQSSGTVTADLTGTLAPGASRFIWIRVKVK